MVKFMRPVIFSLSVVNLYRKDHCYLIERIPLLLHKKIKRNINTSSFTSAFCNKAFWKEFFVNFFFRFNNGFDVHQFFFFGFISFFNILQFNKQGLNLLLPLFWWLYQKYEVIFFVWTKKELFTVFFFEWYFLKA